MPAMSFEQRIKFLLYTPIAVAPLSLFGSVLTIVSLYRTWRKGGRLMTYHRLVLSTSVLDTILSFGYALGPLPLPPDLSYTLPGIDNTVGNQASCSFQAFLIQLGYGSFTASMFLIVYYMLIIRYSLRDDMIRSRIEPAMHFLTWGFHLSVAIAGLFQEVYNPAGGLCWVADKPLRCSEFSFVECERGEEHFHLYQMWLSVVPLITVTSLMLLFLIILAGTVWWRNRQRRRFVFEQGLGYGGAHDSMDRRAQMVITQCFLYGGTMTNAVLWLSVSHIIWTIREGFGDIRTKHYWVQAVMFIFFPLQGFFNFLIYIRPRYLSIRNSTPDASRFWALREAVWFPIDTKTERQSRSISASAGEGILHRLRLSGGSSHPAVTTEAEEAENGHESPSEDEEVKFADEETPPVSPARKKVAWAVPSPTSATSNGDEEKHTVDVVDDVLSSEMRRHETPPERSSEAPIISILKSSERQVTETADEYPPAVSEEIVFEAASDREFRPILPEMFTDQVGIDDARVGTAPAMNDETENNADKRDAEEVAVEQSPLQVEAPPENY